MNFLGWMMLIGALMLLIALLSAYLRHLPISTSFIYLIVGLIIGPLGFDALKIDIIEGREWFVHLAEVAVIFSLFIGGLKLRLPFRHPAWRAAFLLAFPVMICSIAAIAFFAWYVFGLNAATALLLGAVLAPTDPVLASAVTVEDAADNDRMRYGLSGEAGFNDGAAFPFVILGLLWIENADITAKLGEWALYRIVWAIPAGFATGYLMGGIISKLAVRVRSKFRDNSAPNDFLALALIALSYVCAELIHAWGFLAVFAAGLGLRQTEIRIAKKHPHSDTTDEENSDRKEVRNPPAEDLVNPNDHPKKLKKPVIAVGLIVSEILSFGDTIERLLEILLVFIVGIALATHWTPMAIPLALIFFFVVRPFFSMVFLSLTPTSLSQKVLMSWFGIRGIGSLYYVAYALNHGLNENAKFIVDLTVSTVALSIIIHGVSAQPVLNLYEKINGKREKNARQNEAVEAA